MPEETITQTPRKRRRWNWLSLALLTLGLATLVAVAALFFTGAFTASPYTGVGYAEPIGPSIDYFQQPATATAPPVPTEVPSDAPLATFRIPRFEIDAPVVVLGVDDDGAMETPTGPWDVAWYDFTAQPGFGGNAVFSGHVDALYTGTPGPAVFWNLKDLEEGDIIEVSLEDGTSLRYGVVSRWSVEADGADVQQIVGRTEREVITLITCGGELGAEYDQRLIVRAERIPDAPASASVSP